MGNDDLVKLDWSILHPWQFLLAVLISSVAARTLHAALRAIKLAFDTLPVDQPWSWRRYGSMFFRCLVGFRRDEKGTASSTDYGYTFILGIIELSCYPILIATGAWTPIGAWVGLKALAQYKVWSEERSVFNLFLIGNAVNVVISLVLLTRFITSN